MSVRKALEEIIRNIRPENLPYDYIQQVNVVDLNGKSHTYSGMEFAEIMKTKPRFQSVAMAPNVNKIANHINAMSQSIFNEVALSLQVEDNKED